jgi:hypothetical protein
MPACHNKYPGYSGIYEPPAGIYLYSGQTITWSAGIKSTTILVSFWSLDPTGGHPPDRVIDCANKTITLTTPEKKCFRFKSTFELKGSKVNSLKGVSIREVPIGK